MKHLRPVLGIVAFAVGVGPVGADVLELKDGRVLTGQYLGGTAGTLRFQTAEGVQVVETSRALALTFTGNSPAPAAEAPAVSSTPAPAPAPAPSAPPPAPAPTTVTLQAGTSLLVRLSEGVSSRDYPGRRFTTTLESDLIVDGVVAARAGTKVYGKVQQAQSAGRFAGASALDLRLSDLAMGGSLVPLVSGPYAVKGANELGKTAKAAATGAAIGAIVDGGDGAGKGAAIGAGVSGLRRGQPIVVPPGSLLEFRLQQPVNLNVSR
ncbi:MAG: hypothetical protein JNL97_14080 [Verrucomicrobiales bacterium]|nr:hypothetical protein [Verrucomicrobiales bacterium]